MNLIYLYNHDVYCFWLNILIESYTPFYGPLHIVFYRNNVHYISNFLITINTIYYVYAISISLAVNLIQFILQNYYVPNTSIISKTVHINTV